MEDIDMHDDNIGTQLPQQSPEISDDESAIRKSIENTADFEDDEEDYENLDLCDDRSDSSEDVSMQDAQDFITDGDERHASTPDTTGAHESSPLENSEERETSRSQSSEDHQPSLVDTDEKDEASPTQHSEDIEASPTLDVEDGESPPSRTLEEYHPSPVHTPQDSQTSAPPNLNEHNRLAREESSLFVPEEGDEVEESTTSHDLRVQSPSGLDTREDGPSPLPRSSDGHHSNMLPPLQPPIASTQSHALASASGMRSSTTTHSESASAPQSTNLPIRSTKSRVSLLRDARARIVAKKEAKVAAQARLDVSDEASNYVEDVTSSTRPSSSSRAPEVSPEVMEHRKALAEFNKKKQYYDRLKRSNDGRLNFKDDVEWTKIERAENARLRKRQRDIAVEEEERRGVAGDMPLFYDQEEAPEDDEVDDEDMNGEEHIRKRTRHNPPEENLTMTGAELRAMQVGLGEDIISGGDATDGNSGDEEQRGSQSRSKSKSKARSSSKKTSKAKSKGKKSANAPKLTAKQKREAAKAVRQATSLFNSDVFTQQAGQDAAEQPVFQARKKADALKELLASLPLDERKEARGDLNELLAATKKFDGHGAVTSDQNGGWKVRKMKTPLKAYQVIGAGFMRERENDTVEPRGGICADQMGLGKTLQMLANIINGQPPRDALGPKTTLLVASPSLLNQWEKEIRLHGNNTLRIMKYTSGNRIASSLAMQIFENHDIVFTTWNEVWKSYPKNEPPKELVKEKEKRAWWIKQYMEKRGILHRVHFLRIVLDEAQTIKNYKSRTSIACRALIAQHKWCLSGTPIQNNLAELYPYFLFIGVPNTGSLEIFKGNYCNYKSPEHNERLLVRLTQFMIRRTHADNMFGAPILKLPRADQSTTWCEFNPIERMIYVIVEKRFLARIKKWSENDELGKQYNSMFVMLLRLRQLAAHPLMLEPTMRDLLEVEDIENIKQAIKDMPASTRTDSGRTIIQVRKTLERDAAEAKKKSLEDEAARRAENDDDGEDDESPGGDNERDQGAASNDQDDGSSTVNTHSRIKASGNDFGKTYNFKPYLASLEMGESYAKSKERAECSACRAKPVNPYRSSCGHLICGSCYETASLEAAGKGQEQVACKTCAKIPLYYMPLDEEGSRSPTPVWGSRSRPKRKKKNKTGTIRSVEDETLPEDWLDSLGDDVLPSAKTIAIKAQIINWFKEKPGVKIIIYTQFIAMIKILDKVCALEGWLCEKYHGSMSFSAREKALTSFAENKDCNILLASLRAGGLGLNITAASKVIIMDPWWNSSIEQQAFCRVFRIGQQETTFLSRICVANTIDTNMIKMQLRKQEEIDSVMEDDGSRLKKLSIKDLMRLFGNVDEDSEGRPFILVDNPDPHGID